MHFEWQQYRGGDGRAQTNEVTIPRLVNTGYPRFLLEKKREEKREEAKKKRAQAKEMTEKGKPRRPVGRPRKHQVFEEGKRQK